MSKKKVLGGVITGAVVATAVAAKVISDKSKKLHIKQKLLNQLRFVKWDFMRNM